MDIKKLNKNNGGDMKSKILIILCCIAPVLAIAEPNQEEIAAAFRALDWQIGPRTEQVTGKATLKIPNTETLFLDESNSAKFLKLTGNIPNPNTNVVFSRIGNWWANFAFNPIGYVKDDEQLNADELLKQLKDSDGPANEERKKLGLPLLYTDGWYVPPHYDNQTKRLEWGVKLHSNRSVILNYTIRLLGRTGVMIGTLVSSPETMDKDVASFKQVLTGFEFNPGERYSEFRQGDRTAEYGLAALIVGGAAAVATKKGFWAVIAGFLVAAWKAVIAVILAALASLRALFKKKKS